jgi:transcriptional regulator with XRE-family HTH domain
VDGYLQTVQTPVKGEYLASPGTPGGRRLRWLIQQSGLSKAEVARRAEISRQTLYDAIARGTAAEDTSERLARVFGIRVDLLFDAAPNGGSADERLATKEAASEPYSPNPRNRKRLPPRAYERVYGYLQQMEDAGATHEQLDEAERVMVDGAYNKLNTRDVRERSVDEMIGDIDMAWAFIRDLLRKDQLKLK